MDKSFLLSRLQLAAQAVSATDRALAEVKSQLCAILGFVRSCPDNAATTAFSEDLDMLLRLFIPGSLRTRPDGLLEFRSPLGSVYGRSQDELEFKANEKFNEKVKALAKEKALAKVKATAPTLSEFFFSRYLPFKRQTLAVGSVEEISREFNFICSHGLDIPLDSFSPEIIEDFLLSVPASRKRKKLRGIFNNMFCQAKRLGVITSNPCDNVFKVEHHAKTGTALSFAEQDRLFSSLLSNSRITLSNKLFIVFSYLTGARRNEILALSRSDVDFDGGYIHIRGTKTHSSDRRIPLTPLLRRVLQALPGSDRLFNIDQTNASHLFKRVCPAHRLHELRHTYGTISVCVLRFDEKTVSLLLGHSTVQMTLNTYTHPEQLDYELFFNGNLSAEQKLSAMRDKYNAVLNKISEFLDSL